MGTPRTLEVPLTVHGYSLKLDEKPEKGASYTHPHWHLLNRGEPVGCIDVYGQWKGINFEVKSSVREEAEQLTALYADRIREDYRFNFMNGDSDC